VPGPVPTISVVILCYKSEAHIELCLDALAVQTRAPEEVIVVENASGDAAVARAREHFLQPRVIENRVNLGCAGGNNVGWRAATGDIVVFLNPDCMVEPGFLEAIAAPLAGNPSVGLTGGKLYFPNTHILQHAGGILHPNAMTEHRGTGEGDGGQFDEAAAVDYVTGAAFALRRQTLESLGGFDEDYFPAYYEETDLCARVRKAGLTVLYVPGAVGYHLESAAVGRGSARFVRLAYRARLIFLIKNKLPGEWVREVIPFEWHWLRQPWADGFRLRALRSYLEGAAFAVRCLFRGSRRPRSIRRAMKRHGQS
jgi:GT2 family glycosyltransferase